MSDPFTDEDVQRVAVKLWDFYCPGLNPAWADEVAYRLLARELLMAGTERLRAQLDELNARRRMTLQPGQRVTLCVEAGGTGIVLAEINADEPRALARKETP